MNFAQNTRTTLAGIALLVFIAIGLVRIGTMQAQQQETEDIYNHKCAVCHGKDGLGNTAKGKKVHVKDVRANLKDSEAEMIKVVTNGKGDDMDSYKKLYTPQQITGLVAYYRSLGEAATAKK
jgi:mono/diheme cytochrome c family protein